MRFHNFLGSIMQQSLVFWTRLRRLLSRRRLLCRRLRQTAISYGLMTKLAPKLPPHIFVHTTLRKHIHTKDYIDKRLSKPKLSAAPGNSCTLYARYVGWRHYTALHMRGGGELWRRHRCLGGAPRWHIVLWLLRGGSRRHCHGSCDGGDGDGGCGGGGGIDAAAFVRRSEIATAAAAVTAVAAVVATSPPPLSVVARLPHVHKWSAARLSDIITCVDLYCQCTWYRLQLHTAGPHT